MTDLRVPPVVEEDEAALLSGMMLNPEAADEGLDLVSDSDLYAQRNRLVLGAIRRLREAGQEPDAIAVRTELRRRGEYDAVGDDYLARLADFTPTAANVGYHARAVVDAAGKRGIQNFASWAAEQSRNGGSTVELFEEAEQRLFAITKRGGAEAGRAIGPMIEPALEFGGQTERAIRTGLHDLDRLTGGLRPSEFTILGARPSHGKTALGVQTAYQAAKQGHHVAFISLEMGDHATVLRFLSCCSKIPLVKLYGRDQLTREEREGLEAAKRLLSGLPITIASEPRTAEAVRSFARRLSARGGLGLVVLDYVQLLEGSGETRAAEIGSVTRGLKKMAGELEVAVLAAAQLNRNAEHSARPRLFDLKDSGSQEQDADNVWLLHRPGFGMTDREAAAAGVANLAEIAVAKHRQGLTDMVEVRFNGPSATFEDLSRR